MKIKKRADGRYRVNRTINGKVVYFYGKTKLEIENKIKEYEADRASGKFLAKDVYGSEWINLWLEEKALQVTENTLASYKRLINTHLIPAFGSCRLTDISTPLLREFFIQKQNSKLSGRTCQYIYTLLNAILNQAVTDELLPRNPLAPVPKPKKGTAQNFVALTKEQLHKFLEAVPNAELRFLFSLDAATGLRRSELLGLRWQDIDFDRKTLSVNQTVIKIDGVRKIVQNTKNASSRRSISLDDKSIVGLKKQLTRTKYRRISGNNTWVDNDLVFPDNDGSPLNPDTIYRNAIRYAKKADLPEGFTFHSLRHTHATLLLQAGVHFKIVQHRLGHSTFQMTMDVYSHVTPEMDKDAAEIMEAII